MEKITFQAIVKKGNDRGVGFIAIPKELRINFTVGDQLKVTINSDIVVYAKIRFYGTLGFYIPYEVMHQRNLINKFVEVEIEKIDGFYASVGHDGRVYIPQKVAEKFSLRNNDIIEIQGNINGLKQIKYPMLSVRTKSNNSTDYMFPFDAERAGNFGIFNVIRKLDNDKKQESLLHDLYYGTINNEKIILYNGNHQPVMVNKNIALRDISHYLGCYFSDGTKRGWNWGICASSFEQANYYYKMHQFLIKDCKIVPTITFTDTQNNDEKELADYLRRIWGNYVHSLVDEIKVRIIKSNFKPSLKTHKFGCLVMKENRQLTQIYYNKLLVFLFDEIESKRDRELAVDFLCGVLEGDGCVGPEGRGHLVIATNNVELKILTEVLSYAGFKHNIRKEGENKSCIHIGLLEVIRNISILKDKIFRYYPKRRKLLKERLSNTSSVRFLLGENKKTSNWLVGQFNKMNILDGKGNLTEFGEKIQKDLREFFEIK